MNKKEIIFSAIAIIITVLAIMYSPRGLPVPKEKEGGDEVISAVFICPDNKNIQAKFYNQGEGYVYLVLSDGRTIQVPRAISASGARYANADESFVFWNKGNKAFIEEQGTTTYVDCVSEEKQQTEDTPPSLANPASVYCQEKGGRLSIEKKEDGSEYGLCYFDDNRACEEWAMLRGDCPIGGVKTTGYDTVAQKFCAWAGGRTFAMENAICEFSDGTSCPAEEFYTGTCQKGIKPE